ncbi:MAG: hydratase [Anaerolineaceae bacterium]|nr:hydratase [Anaerolineaceae bacterium]
MKLIDHNVIYSGGRIFEQTPDDAAKAKALTMAYQIMSAHSSSAEDGTFRIRFDAMVSHDITYVGIIQTARGSGMKEFPLPYALTNCHNSLCAIGGTINEDDHLFGLSAAKKYGGIFVPAHQAVIHQYAREMLSGCGKMILGSDSHTRYGCFGTMGFGEGGPELVKQLLKNTYDLKDPQVILVYLTGKPRKGIGPHDVALALIREVFKSGFVKNKILEFVGPGIAELPMDFRTGIDVMTTETACLSSIWTTDETTEEFFRNHGRKEDYKKLEPGDGACYDGAVVIDLSEIESMIALPFHPSNAYTIHEFLQNADELLSAVEEDTVKQFGTKVKPDLRSKFRNGAFYADQGVIAGCSGGMFDNICIAADILENGSIGSGHFGLSVYPSSTPIQKALLENGVSARLLADGAILRSAFCGPCFGAGDVPANNEFSIRHTTRNFPNREGSKPDQGQISFVALMDARSIAATAANGGKLTAATDIDFESKAMPYTFSKEMYEKRIYNGYQHGDPNGELHFGPNITDWPRFNPLAENMLLKLAAVIHDPVTTTDELIPSGETSSYRSNPLKLSEFALSRRVPEYVGRSKEIMAVEKEREDGNYSSELISVLEKCGEKNSILSKTEFGSAIFAEKPGDGSAREQAASCQRVLGGRANIVREYATKRYRSNCINWGILPFTISKETPFDYEAGNYIFVPGIRKAIENGQTSIPAMVINGDDVTQITLKCDNLSDKEKQIILDGCLMNYYAAAMNKD